MMRYRIMAAVMMLWVGQAALAQGSARFTGQDLFALNYASDTQISGDGRSIAYVRMTGDIMVDRWRPTIWTIDVATREQRPIATGDGAHFSPRWSPDGTRLAYLSTEEGRGAQLLVRWMDSGETVRLTNLPNTPNAIAWSPDGRQIAYTMLVPASREPLGSAPTRPEGAEWADPLAIHRTITFRSDGAGYLRDGSAHIFVISADGGSSRQLTSGDTHSGAPRSYASSLSWSPDGREIITSANIVEDWQTDPVEGEVYAIDVATGTRRALTDRDGPDFAPQVSPDGRLIAYLGFDDRRLGYHNIELYVMDRNGSNRRSLTASLDRSLAMARWSANSRSLIVAYEDAGTMTIARVGLNGSHTVIADGIGGDSMDRPYAGVSFSVAGNGVIAAYDEQPDRPADVVVIRGGNVSRLTDLNATMLSHRRMGEVRRVAFPSSVDGRTIEAWVTLPPDYVEGQRYPMVLEIHGGPYASYGPNFATDNQLYAAGGYIVVSPNPRGSTGYGAEFTDFIQHAYPGQDYDDLMSVVDGLIADGMVDSDALFVTGGSGGGVLTSWIIGRTNRFRAAATQKPVINWTSMALTADGPSFTSAYWFGTFPWEDHEAFWSRSPLSLVGNVETPTLVIVGEEDYRTPRSEAEQYYSALNLRGVPTALITIPGASHGGYAGRPSQSAARVSAILAWFDRYRENAWVRPVE